jgi:hypothetical protein
VAVNNSIKVGPLVLLLLIFVIMQNFMKCPVFVSDGTLRRQAAFPVLQRSLFFQSSTQIAIKA